MNNSFHFDTLKNVITETLPSLNRHENKWDAHCEDGDQVADLLYIVRSSLFVELGKIAFSEDKEQESK